MPDWKELGEVPDSDDEGFDSEETEHEQASNTYIRRPNVASKVNPRQGDIWDLPDSSPLSEAQELPNNWSGLGASPLRQTREPTSSSLSSLPPTASSTSKQTGGRSQERPTFDISSSSEIEDDPFRLRLDASHSNLIVDVHGSVSSPRHAESEGNGDEQTASWRTAVRLERSLRPRKPIQEHPYQLEGARYATVMKSHGIRPVAVISAAERAPGKQQEEESQDPEFRAEESQQESGTAAQQLPEENQSMAFDDRDELTLSPPSARSSSARKPLATSSQPPSSGQTNDSSLLEEDELPSLEDLLRRAKPNTSSRKRLASPKFSSVRKRRIVQSSSPVRAPLMRDVWNLSSSPIGVQPPYDPSQDLGNTPLLSVRHALATPPVSKSVQPSSTLAQRRPIAEQQSDMIDLTETLNISSDSETSSPDSASESEADIIRQNSRRIRGVLPASWLRLDQQKLQKTDRGDRVRRRTPEHSPEPLPRKGVALPRQPSTHHSKTVRTDFLLDDSEEEQEATDTSVAGSPSAAAPVPVIDLYDNGVSAIEEDYVDRMMPSRIRDQSPSGRLRRPEKRKRTQRVFDGRPGKPQQQKITGMFTKSKSAISSARHHSKQPKLAKRRVSSMAPQRRRQDTPPLLSILDVAEAEAPRFIKIAARTARKRKNLGRTSPTRKNISLPTRIDNIDVQSVLQEWRAGKIQQKVQHHAPSTMHHNRLSRGRQPLQDISSNERARPRPPSRLPPKLSTEGSMDVFVTASGVAPQSQESSAHYARPHVQKQPWKPRRPAIHAQPAQLENPELESADKARFTARKRALDAVFRRNRKSSSTAFRLDTVADAAARPKHFSDQQQGNVSRQAEQLELTQSQKQQRVRHRKPVAPKRLDLSAAQFTHATDPLPPPAYVVEELVESPKPYKQRDAGKLLGLGPYGTQYTQHFEIFPLDPGVFFHESTLIGAGTITKILALHPDKMRYERPSISFTFDRRTMYWGCWNESVSSELGVLVDWIVDQQHSHSHTTSAAGFILEYVLSALSFQDADAEASFISRSLEVLESFIDRLGSNETARHSPEQDGKTLIAVLQRFLLVIYSTYKIAQDSGAYDSHSFHLETLLQKAAKILARTLLNAGLDKLRILFGELQGISAKERGIRSDDVVANGWMVLVKVLEHAMIPRALFWDVTYSGMLTTEVVSSCDAQKFEKLWEDMFTLLPLCEVDDTGILLPGRRHNLSFEGWSLPQKLLSQVFRLYQANPKQSPSFNEYCRTLVWRCHYLAENWGWKRCSAIIGTIFDFFGSQSLEHLRNEEVYKSPHFLEELTATPSLMVEPEDRCFHIFIKMLGMVIKRLRQLKLDNEIRNLVTRTLPNHNRQYLKEDSVHQHELGALRNHHDLLCTLFWAAPPELRPGIHLIEKLVLPGSSHKEACLINLRAWNQLARFVIASAEGVASYKPFVMWQNNFFQAIVEQYLSAEDDIQQQFRTLSKEALNGISQDMMKAMIRRNKAAAMDLLFSCIRASLDVLKHAESLATAAYALNTFQLDTLFTRFNFSASDFDWSILRAAMDLVDHFLTRIETAVDHQYSSDSVSLTDTAEMEEASLLLDHKLSKSFFSMARSLLALPNQSSALRPSDQTTCTEKVVEIAARIASRFIHAQSTRLSQYFSRGTYGLFERLPEKLSSQQQRYLPLFLATLFRNNVFDYKDLGTTPVGLWMMSIVKPARHHAYENVLASALKENNFPFLPRTAARLEVAPSYNSNRDFVSASMHYMRSSLRTVGSVHGRQLRSEYGKTLELVMHRMKEDLKALSGEHAEHNHYVDFVREIISLVKSYGVGICVVDPFFIQPSADYSPSMQDPRMHTAGIVAYGVRLGEGESTAVPQLFHYLYNNFKIALTNGKLQDEGRILERAMDNPHVLSFVLGKMLPATIQATRQTSDAWLLLEVYCMAVEAVLTRSCMPKEISESGIPDTGTLLSYFLDWASAFRDAAVDGAPSAEQLRMFMRLAGLANALQHSLTTYSYLSPDPFCPGLRDTLADMYLLAKAAVSYSNGLLESGPEQVALESINVRRLFDGVSSARLMGIGGRDAQVASFTSHIVADVRKNWEVAPAYVCLKSAGRGTGISVTQSGQGSRYEAMPTVQALQSLRAELAQWRLGEPVAEEAGRSVRRRRGSNSRAYDFMI